MKILVFTTLYPNNVWPNHGVFVKERMTAVARLGGCDLRVIAPIPYYPPVKFGSRAVFNKVARREVIDGVRIYHPRYLLIPKIGMLLHGLMMFLSVVLFVKKLKNTFEFDVIDAHYVYPDGFAAVLLGWVLGKPVVVSARGTDINVFSMMPLVRRLLIFTLRKANHVIAVSEALQRLITRLGIFPEKVSLILNGVDAVKFRRIPRDEARKLLRLPLDYEIILSVGGLNQVKGFGLLLRAFKIFLETQENNKCRLLIVGEGALRNELTQLIAKLDLTSHAELVGMVPHAELYRWYSAANIFCLASEREGSPNVVLEALSCGIPVVAAPVGGIPEILNSENIGLLSDRDEEAFAETLQLALTRKWDTNKITSAAKTYTWQETATKVTILFESILNSTADRLAADAESASAKEIG